MSKRIIDCYCEFSDGTKGFVVDKYNNSDGVSFYIVEVKHLLKHIECSKLITDNNYTLKLGIRCRLKDGTVILIESKENHIVKTYGGGISKPQYKFIRLSEEDLKDKIFVYNEVDYRFEHMFCFLIESYIIDEDLDRLKKLIKEKMELI